MLTDNKMAKKLIDKNIEVNKIIIIASNQELIKEIMSRYKNIPAIE